MAQTYGHHSKISQEQPLEDHAALLRDEIFNVILGTVNTEHGNAFHVSKMKSGSDFGDDEGFHLPQVPDMPIAGSGHGHKVTFRSPVVRPESVSTTHCLVPQPVSFDLSRIPDTETSGKATDREAEVKPKTPHQKVKRTSNDVSITFHSLQLMAEEFRKICKSKIQKLKGRYPANTMLVLNSWLKDIEMCVSEWKLTNMEAVQLVKAYTTEAARGAIELYLDTNSTWNCEELIEHLRTSFESGKTFSSLVRDFYSNVQ